VADARRRIFVVDDQPDVAESLARLLQSMGHLVEYTTDPRAALSFARSFMPHIVFLDIGMPHVDGYELAKAMKDSPELERAKIVAVSAYGESEHRALSRKAGFDAHVQKPMAIDLLESVLTQFPSGA